MAADIGTLNPEQMLQQQQILRQQKMAEMLMQQPLPQGQMIGNRYVAPSFTQNLASLANVYFGQRGIDKANQAQIDLAKQLRADETSAMADFMQQKQGRPAVPEQVTEMAGPYGQGVGQAGANVPMPTATIAGTPEIKANPQAAYANLMANPKASPRLQNMAFNKMIADPEAFTLSADQTRFVTMPDGTTKQVAAGTKKPIQIDTGTAIEFRDPDNMSKVLQRIPKSQMPTAGQIYESAESGPLVVNTRAGTATPLLLDGKPIAPKLSSEQNKDILAINQQRSTIDGAIADVKANKSAFSFGRGMAQNAPYGESIAGRFEKPEDTQARAYVFNNVSSVIKERAGTAQSAQELQRLNSFLPATTDNADQIVSKLQGFKQYLKDLESGTRVPTAKLPEPTQSNSFSSEADAQKAFNSGKLKAGQKVIINGVSGTWQ
jgi:hypothetical protein